MSEPPQFRVGGRTICLVPSAEIESWSRELAASRLRDAAGEWPTGEVILRLSERMFGPSDDLERAIAFLVESFDRGRLLALRLTPPAAGRPRIYADDVPWPDWSEIPMLSDLRRIDDTDEVAPPPPVSPAAGPGDPGAPSGGNDDPIAPTVHFVAFSVTDQDGAPLRGRYECSQGGATWDGELADAATRIEPTTDAGSASLQVAPAGYLAASRPAPRAGWTSLPSDGVQVDLADRVGPLELPLDRTTRIVVQVPKATVFTVPAYDLDLEIVRPGWLSFDEATAEGITGLGCIAQALDYARTHPERFVLVVGHTDTTGSKAHNRGVSERRAAHLAALLRGDLESWVASCMEDATLSDLAAHLQWAAGRFGWACEVAPTATTTPAFREALERWREGASELVGIAIDPDSDVSSEDWRIAFALIDLALAEELDLGLPDLAALRAGLQWCDPPIVGAGELWPKAWVGSNGVSSSVNRRTEILFATTAQIPGGAGDPAGESIFGDDAWLWLDYVVPQPRAALPVALVSAEGVPVPSTPFKIVSAGGRVRYGRLGPQGDALVDDVLAGDFRIHWLDHDDITTKIWASRCDAAFRAGAAAPVLPLLERSPALIVAVARVWAERFGDGRTEGLAESMRGLAKGTTDELVIDYLLCAAGFAGDTEYETVSGGDR